MAAKRTEEGGKSRRKEGGWGGGTQARYRRLKEEQETEAAQGLGLVGVGTGRWDGEGGDRFGLRVGGQGRCRPVARDAATVSPPRCARTFGRGCKQIPGRNARSRSHSDVLCFPQTAVQRRPLFRSTRCGPRPACDRDPSHSPCNLNGIPLTSVTPRSVRSRPATPALAVKRSESRRNRECSPLIGPDPLRDSIHCPHRPLLSRQRASSYTFSPFVIDGPGTFSRLSGSTVCAIYPHPSSAYAPGPLRQQPSSASASSICRYYPKPVARC